MRGTAPVDVEPGVVDEVARERWERWMARAGAWQRNADDFARILTPHFEQCTSQQCFICHTVREYRKLGGGVR